MKFRSMVLGLAVVLFAAANLSAQNTYERLSVIEEFTSATCPPCVPASETLNGLVKPENGVVSVRYHMNWPAPNDPWNIDNPAENQSRRNFYSVTGIPNGYLNGRQASMTNGPALEAGIASANAQMAPLGFEITQAVNQTGGDVTVKVKTNIDLKSHTLHVAVVSRFKHLPNLPSELANSNGETEFYDAMNKMLPNGAGTSLDISAGGEETFNFSYTAKAERTWPAGQQYIVAFVQSNADRAVLNAGTNLDIISARAEVMGEAWAKIAKEASDTKTITLYNDRDEEMDVDLSVANYDALVAAGWGVDISSPFAKIPANGSTDITVTTTAPSSAAFAGLELVVTPVVSGGIAEEASVVFGYLTEGAKVAVYYGADAGSAGNIIPVLTTTHATDAVYMPFSAETNAAFPSSDFDAAIFPVGFDGRFNIVAFIPAINQMQAAGKGVWLHAPVGPAVALNDNNQQFPGYPEAKAWFTSIGVTQYSTVNRNDGQFITSFQVTGVDGNDIGNNWAATANQPSQQWPFRMIAQDLIRNPGQGSVSWVFADNNQNNVNGVHWTDGQSRVVFSTFGPEHIADANARNVLTQRVLDWLLAADNNGPQISVDNSILNFGDVEVGSDRELGFVITNSGNEDLIISDIQLSGPDAIDFDITDGRISGGDVTLAPNETHEVKVAFMPGAEKNNITASVVITANAAAAPVRLLGNGTTTSVETEVVSETGSISMKLVGQNPVVNQTAIALTATQQTTVQVVDASGSVVAQLFNGITSGTQNIDVNASNFASGTYTIIATNGAERAALTIVVAK